MPLEPAHAWLFDDGAGATATAYKGGADGTLVGAVAWDAVEVPLAYAGNGSVDIAAGSHVNKVDVPGLATAFNDWSAITVSMWIKADTDSADMSFLGLRNSGVQDHWGARYDAVGATGKQPKVIKAAYTTTDSLAGDPPAIDPNLNQDQYESAANTATTDWQHVALTYADGVGFRMYINGVPDVPSASPSGNTGLLAAQTLFWIGDGAKANWDGHIDEVAVWNYDINAGQAEWLYTNSLTAISVPGQALDRTNGASGNRPPIGLFDGDTDPLPTEAGGLINGNHVFSDRTYLWEKTPPQLAGSDYIRTFNTDKDNPEGVNVNYQVVLDETQQVFVTVDDRFGDKQGYVDAVTTASGLPAGTFQDTGLNLRIGGDNQNISVFVARLVPGVYDFAGGGQSNNFHTIGALTTQPLPAPQPDANCNIKINFEAAGSDDPTPAGYLADTGDVFGDRGNGQSYGWDQDCFKTRDRDAHADERYDSINHMEHSNVDRYWEIALPAGRYDLFIVCGDPSNTDSDNDLWVEGIIVSDDDGQGDHFEEYTLTVDVADGALTIGPAIGSHNAKIAFLHITPEPATLALVGLGLGLSGLMRRRRK